MTTERFTNGAKLAEISYDSEIGYTVWVGQQFSDGATVPARVFDGHRNCSKTFRTIEAARKAARKYVA